MSAVLFDLGGTHLRCAILDEDGCIKHIRKERIDSFVHGYEPTVVWNGILTSMLDFERSVRNKVPSGAPMGLSFPGPIAQPSRILSAPTVVGNASLIPDLGSQLSNATGRKVHIINDISAAAWYFSRIVPQDRFIVVTVSSGIGSKIFDKGHSRGVIDDTPYAGEIGHVMVDDSPAAMMCDCGGKGHLGAISSGRGIERYARRIAGQDPESFAKSACVVSFGANSEILTNESHLAPAARIADEWALNVIRKCTRHLARMLLSVTVATGLEKIVVIGGFAQSLGQTYLDILQSELVELCDYHIMADSIHHIAMLGDQTEEACLEGVGIYAQKCS